MSYHSELCPDALVQTPADSVSIQLPHEQEDVVPSKREKCFNCCKKFTAFLCSTIGLTSMLIGYTIFGGFIFKNLESPHELRQKSAIKQSRAWHVQRLWNATLAMNVFYEENWTRMAEELLLNFTDQVYEATKKHGWDGTDGTADVQWTFAGAMLYSITVITTIGYGHIAPKTMWGRIVTILYAMIGIPLCLLTLTNLGGFMATAFRFIYNNICCGLCCLCCEYHDRAQVKSAALKYKDAGNGDPGAAEALTGVSSPDSGASSKGSRSPTKRKVSTTVTWRSGLKRVLKTDDNKAVRVPIYVSLLLIAGYILSGAVLFTLWEKDWDYLEGSYFCFITLTTIGFGDFVPGTSQDSWNNQQKLVLCAMYLIIGLSLIAMCFDLMQEEARNKVRALGAKLGLFDDDKKGGGTATGLEHAPRATQTMSPAAPKPSKSSSSSSFKNFVLAKPKSAPSKSPSSLETNNVDQTPEVHLTKKQRKELERERKAAEKREQEERRQREKREQEEQKAREKREQEERKARDKREQEERKLREKREKEEKKAAAKREKERLVREKKEREREKRERVKRNKHKKGPEETEAEVHVEGGQVLGYTQIPRSPEIL